MKKRFIVLIDFSEYSVNLLKYASDWSRWIDAEILLVHKAEFVISGRLSNKKIESIKNRTISEGIQRLQEFGYSVLPVIAQNVKYKIVLFNLTTALSELLEEPFDNMIFVGLKGTGLLKRLFLGSVAIDVIEKTNSLVVAAPKEVEIFSPEKLLVAIREEYPLNVQALTNLLHFFGNYIPPIHFFTVANPNENIAEKEKHLSEVTKPFAWETNSTFAVYQGDDFIDQIKKMIINTTRELLVVQKGSRFLKDLLLRKFMINELIYEGKTPLIVLP